MSIPESIWPTLMSATARVTVIVGIAWIAILCARRWSPSQRHCIWAACLMGALALPFAAGLLPAWTLAVMPQQPQVPAQAVIQHEQPVSAPQPLRTYGNPNKSAAPKVSIPERPAGTEVLPDRQFPIILPPAPGRPTAVGAPKPAMVLNWSAIAAVIWLIGFGVLILRLCLGLISVRLAGARCRGMDLQEVGLVPNGVVVKIGLDSSLHYPSVPLTYGVFNPVILLPYGAEGWPKERLNAAVSHEIAHIRRHDWILQILAYISCALYWYHPLVWLASRRMRVESELACDDLAMESGIAPADYAMHLLDVARSASQLRYGAAVVAMAQTSKIEARLMSILAPERRRGTVTRAVLAVLVLAAAIITVPMAVIRLAAKTVDSVENWNGIPVIVHSKGNTEAVGDGYVFLSGLSDSASAESGWWATDGTPVVGGWPQGFVGQGVKPSGRPGRDIAVSADLPLDSQPEINFAASALQNSPAVTGQSDLASKDGKYYVHPDLGFMIAPDNQSSPLSGRYERSFVDDGTVDTRIVQQRAVPSAAQIGEVLVAVASGPWTQTVDCPAPKTSRVVHTTSGDVRFTLGKEPSGFDFLLADKSKYAFISVTDQFGINQSNRFPAPFDQGPTSLGNYSRRVYALDKDGNVLAYFRGGVLIKLSGHNGAIQSITEAAPIPASLVPKIATLRLALRPYKWVEFKNVAMQPVSTAKLTPAANPVPSQGHGAYVYSGVVQDESGKPVAGANVVLDMTLYKDGDPTLLDRRTTVSSASGMFTLQTAIKQSDRLNPNGMVDGRVYATSGDRIALPNSIRLSKIVLTLHPSRSVNLTLTDERANPMLGLHATFFPMSDKPFAFPIPTCDPDLGSFITDSGGTATLQYVPTDMRVHFDVTEPEYITGRRNDMVDMSKTLPGRRLTQVVSPAGTISGRVVFRKDTPSNDVFVVFASGPSRFGAGQVDSNGLFTIHKLVPGRYFLRMSAVVLYRKLPGGSQIISAPVWVNVLPGKTTAGVNIPLIDGGVIKGTVRNIKTGAPLAGIEVGATSSTGAITDRSGRYVLHVAPGRPSVYLFAAVGPLGSMKAVEIANDQTKIVDFSIPPPPKSVDVNGVVVDASGKPVPNATVVAVGDMWPEMDTKITTDGNGRFDFSHRPQGASLYSGNTMTADRVLYASSGSMRSPAGVPVHDGGSFTLRVASTALATVHGRVVDPDGTPVPGVAVTCYRQTQIGMGFPEGQTVADSNGDFTLIPTVVSGRFLIQAASGQNYQYTAPVPPTGVHPGQHIDVGSLVGDFDYSADDYDNMSVCIEAVNRSDDSGKAAWFGAGGETLASAPKYWPQSFPQAFRTQPGMKEVIFAIVVNDPGQTGRLGNLSWKAEVDGNTCSVTTIPLPKIAALGPRRHYAIHVLMPADAEKCTLQVSGGQVWDVHTLDTWYRTSAVAPWQSAGFNDGHLYFMLNPNHCESSVVIHSLAFDPNTMDIFAVDTKGKDLYPVPDSVWVGTDKSRTMPRPIVMAEFGVPPSQIKEVIVESNPHKWESIRNIHIQ